MSRPLIVALDGDIDLAVAGEVEQRLTEGAADALERECDLYVDLGAVTFIDSTGLACIVRAVATLDAGGRRELPARVPRHAVPHHRLPSPVVWLGCHRT